MRPRVCQGSGAAACRRLTLLAIALFTGACDSRHGAPGLATVLTAGPGSCPDITGTFYVADRVGYEALAGHYEENPRRWSVLSIAGNPQQGLQVTLYEQNSGRPYAKAIKLNRGSAYTCRDGWLEKEWPRWTPLREADDEARVGTDLLDKSLGFAKNRAGELVIRTKVSHWKGLSVWCGDGCLYLPIPLTRREYFKWAHWPSTTIPAPVPAAEPGKATVVDTDTDAPPDESPAGRVLRLLREIAPLGVDVVRVDPEDDHWVARFRGTNDELLATHQALLESKLVSALLRVQAEHRGSGEKDLDVSLEIQPDKTARTKQEAVREAASRSAAAQRGEADRLVKVLLKDFPKGLVLTNAGMTAEGLLVEVRHADDIAFYDLIVNVKASGSFEDAAIRTRKYIDNAGLQVVDMLFVPKR